MHRDTRQDTRQDTRRNMRRNMRRNTRRVVAQGCGVFYFWGINSRGDPNT